jgi:hypothetical protein
MQASNAPTKVPLPFANGGAKNAIPTPSQQTSPTPAAASWTDGFPPLTRTPIAAGGIPPAGLDMNGVLNTISAGLQWENAGGSFPYDATFSTAIGGYPRGAVLARADLSGFWLNQTDNNTTNPDTGGAGWVAAFSSGVVGQMRNAKMSVTAASATATFTADEIVVETALGGQTYRLANYSQTINLATTGAGGMDTGAAPVSGYVALYAIYNPTSGAQSILATNAATLQGNVYGGANMPAGFTASALVSVRRLNSSAQFTVSFQRDRKIAFPLASVLSTSTPQPTFTSLSVSGFAPVNAVSIGGAANPQCTTSTTLHMQIASDSNGNGAQFVSGNGQAISGTFEVDVSTPQTIFYTTDANGLSTATFAIFLSFYRI